MTPAAEFKYDVLPARCNEVGDADMYARYAAFNHLTWAGLRQDHAQPMAIVVMIYSSVFCKRRLLMPEVDASGRI